MLEGDRDTPTSTGNEYLLRRDLLNQGIKTWEQEPNTQWKELWAKLSAAADGGKTTVASQANYAAPTNFRYPLGYLRIESTSSVFYPYYTPQARALIDTADTTTKFYYIMGDPGAGYTIYIHPTPSTTDNTITYEYYKTATELSTTAGKPEMSDHLFLIDYALHHLRRRAGDLVGAREAMASANARMDNMKDRNEMVPWDQSNAVPDIDFLRGVGGFGV